MATLEIGSKDKTISYLNMVKTGARYKNENHSDVCEIKQSFGNSPWLSRQSDYYISISRFCVPLHSVPIIAAMPNAITVWRFQANHFHMNMVDGLGLQDTSHARWEPLFHALETEVDPNGDGVARIENDANIAARISIPACDTVYAFQRALRDLLGAQQVVWPPTGDGYYLQNILRITLGPDYKFNLFLRDDVHERFYVRFSEPFFKMCQFRETVVGLEDVQTDLYGRRFVAIDTVSAHRIWTYSPAPDAGQPPPPDEIFAIWEAPSSSADNINRIKKIVFTSDAQVKSEANTESSYRRFLVDFLITNPTTISYQMASKYFMPSITNDATEVTEELPGNQIYQADNPSGGRVQELISDAAMYEIAIHAYAQVWSFKKDRLEQIEIPLNAGSTFSCKLVFISRTDAKPDRHHV